MATTKTTTAKKTAEKATETAERNAEAFAEAGQQAFREGIERTTATIGDFSAYGKENMDAMIESLTITTKGVEDLNTSAAAYAKDSVEGSVEAAKSMASAKSVQEVIEIQSEYAKSSMDRYVSEMTKTTDLLTGLVKNAWRPLNDRAAKTMEQVQAQR
ncbi:MULTISPECIES: phasin family protein [Euryhalocaulis]|uniref:phasin family protein n=1 Tax=Euryhalocaulis TaxID=1712422 RepID=UPI0003A914D9|nr:MULTISPECIES: phasin family protein [Euryhalocaulis]MBA4800766.1 phasin family protein [Euryhalocaulis sp.]